MEYLREIWFVIYAVIVIGVMVRIIMDNREPSKTMAWVLVLWFLPLLGIILYFFFGQDTRKERLVSQRSLDQLTSAPCSSLPSKKTSGCPSRTGP